MVPDLAEQPGVPGEFGVECLSARCRRRKRLAVHPRDWSADSGTALQALDGVLRASILAHRRMVARQLCCDSYEGDPVVFI